MRENYRKCLKKRELKSRSGAGSTKLPVCNFFTELQFLTDTLKNKPSDSNLVVSRPETTKENTEDPIEVDFTPKKSVPKRKRDEKQEQQQQQPCLLDVAIIDTLKSSRKKEEPEEKDGNLLFCLSLVDTLRSLSSRDNALLKLKILFRSTAWRVVMISGTDKKHFSYVILMFLGFFLVNIFEKNIQPFIERELAVLSNLF